MVEAPFWYEAVFRLRLQHIETVEAALYDLGALAVTLQDAAEQPLFEPKPGETPFWNLSSVNALFAHTLNPQDLKQNLQARLSGVVEGGFKIQRVENQCWERAWMEHYRPMHFGNRLSVYPRHIPPEDSTRVNILLDPGLAFGTGTHPTTALCLRWLDVQELDGKTCIDYGCGSGILAIAARKLGAQSVYAVDIDPQAITATQQNARDNDIISGLHPMMPDQLIDLQADIVLANILSNTLIELAGMLTALVKPGGSLILSGILSEQAASVRHAFIKAFDFTVNHEAEGWILLAAMKRAG